MRGSSRRQEIHGGVLSRQSLRRSARRSNAPDVHVVVWSRLRSRARSRSTGRPATRPDCGCASPLEKPSRISPGVGAGAVGDEQRIAGRHCEIDEPGAIGRPGGRVGALAQERPRRAAGQRHEQLRFPVSPMPMNQISAPSPEKPKLRRMRRRRRQRRDVSREVDETSGAHLAHPEVELTVAVGEERDEPAVGRNLGAAFGALPIGEARELRVGQRVIDGGGAVPSSQPARSGRHEAQHDDRDAQRRAPAPRRRHDGRRRRGGAVSRQDLQAERQIARRLKPRLARFLQTARDDALERRRHVGRRAAPADPPSGWRPSSRPPSRG